MSGPILTIRVNSNGRRTFRRKDQDVHIQVSRDSRALIEESKAKINPDCIRSQYGRAGGPPVVHEWWRCTTEEPRQHTVRCWYKIGTCSDVILRPRDGLMWGKCALGDVGDYKPRLSAAIGARRDGI